MSTTLPTTTRNYQFSLFAENLEVDGESMSIGDAFRRFPEDSSYIRWFVETYQLDAWRGCR
jgi:hypothetical protein